jgi:hypothetical protein
MFGFGKKKMSADEAIIAYMSHTMKVAEKAYPDWTNTLKEELKVHTNLNDEQIDEFLTNSSHDAHIVHFVGLLTMDAVTIQNCFDEKTAKALYESLLRTIRTYVGDVGEMGEAIARSVSTILGMVTDGIERKTFYPNEAIAVGLMNLLEFQRTEETIKLYDNPIFIRAISMPILEVGSGWWSEFSENISVKV